MTWAGKRRLFYFGIVFFVAILFVGYLIYPMLTKPATCTDTKKNGDERGVDCGGACELVCPFDAVDILVVWSRSFEVIPGIYNSVSYIENQNPTSGIKKISYEFKLYDSENKFIASRKGSTFISPAGKTAIFESGINTGVNRIPKRTTFSFSESPIWHKVGEKASSFNLIEKDIVSESLETTPKISAVIQNTSLYPFGEFDVIAIAYNEFGNAIGASKTYIDFLGASSSQNVYFTWPKPFEDEVKNIEIVPRLNAFNLSYIK